METLDQGISTALMLLGLAALLFGVAALWRSIGNAKAQQQDLQLERASQELAAQRLRERAARDQGHHDLLLALIPAGTALVGHWLGGRSLPPPCSMPRPVDDGRQTVELDLRELLDAVMELGVEKWLADLRPNAHVVVDDAEPVDDEPEPTPGVAPGMS